MLILSGNTGLGKEAVDQIAAHNPAHIYLAARTPSKGEAAVASVKNLVSDVPITYLPLDLSSFDSIVSAVQSFKSKSDHLDVLMNNAGIMATPSDTTKEGYEIQFGTNHIGHALLTKLLLPTLLSTAEKPGSDVRIVNLTSEGHRLAPSGGIVFDQAKLKDVGPWGRYGQSKLSNILFAKELAKRYPSITSVAVHPGVIITNLYTPNAQTSFLMRIFVAVSGSFLGKPSTGALNQLWAATAAKDELSNGAYYTPIGKPSSGSGYAKDDKLANALWEWTEDELTSNEFST